MKEDEDIEEWGWWGAQWVHQGGSGVDEGGGGRGAHRGGGIRSGRMCTVRQS